MESSCEDGIPVGETRAVVFLWTAASRSHPGALRVQERLAHRVKGGVHHGWGRAEVPLEVTLKSHVLFLQHGSRDFGHSNAILMILL